MAQETKKPRVLTAGIVFSLLVGFSFIFTKFAVGVATPLQMITYRFDFALLAIGFAILFKLAKVDFQNKNMKEAILVAIFYGGFFILQAIGITFSTSLEAGILYAIVPIITMILAAIVLQEKTTFQQKLSVLMAVLGVVLLFVIGSEGVSLANLSFLGLMLLFLSSVSLSIGCIFIRKTRDEFTPTEISFVIVIFCAIVFNFASIITGLKDGTLGQFFEPLKNLNFIMSVAYLGITCTYLTSVLRSYLLANTEAVKATLFGNVGTGVSILAGVLIFGEPLELYHIVCTAMIIIGVMGTSMTPKSKEVNHESTTE